MILSGGLVYGDGDGNGSPSGGYKENYAPSTGVAGNLEYVKMLQNNNLTVRIITPTRDIIKGGLTSDFGFNLGNQWNNIASIKDIPLIGDISQGVVPTLAAFFGATQGSLDSLWMTSASWSGYTMPVFPIRMTLINYSKTVNLFNQMLSLAEGMLTPEIAYDLDNAGDLGSLLKEGQQAAANFFYESGEKLAKSLSEKENQVAQYLSQAKFTEKAGAVLAKGISQIGTAAPLNYGLTIDEADRNNTVFKPIPYTTFGLQIGNWFSANNLLMNVGNFSFSKEVNPNGSPISMDIDLTFRPYRNISFKEFSEYFVKNTLRTTDTSIKVTQPNGLPTPDIGGQS